MDWARPIETPTMVRMMRASAESGSVGAEDWRIKSCLRCVCRRALNHEPCGAFSRHVAVPDQRAGLVPHAPLRGGNAAPGVNDLAFACERAGPIEYRTHEADAQIHGGISLSWPQHGVHGAPHRRVEEGRNPAAMHAAERVIKSPGRG